MTVIPPIRVAFCITELDPGGAERALTQLVLNLNRTEWEPHVICLGPRAHYAEILESAKIPVVCLNASGTLSLPRVLYQLVKELRRLRPAILQTFLFHANILGRIAAQFAGVQTVVSGLRVAERRGRWYGRIDRWTNGLVKTNVCVSQGVAEFSQNVVGLHPTKLVVVPNAVEIERFTNVPPADLQELGIPAGSRVLISIGRMERQKGFDVLLNAISLLNPIPKVTYFLIVGDGPDLAQLKAQAIQKNIDEHVRFTGRRDDIPQLLAASTALILPSRWEGMANVVLEAMAASRPVIATRVEGVAELVIDGVTGLTVPSENPAALAEAISLMLSHADFLSNAGQTSQDICKKQFAVKHVVDAYASLYRRLIEQVVK